MPETAFFHDLRDVLVGCLLSKQPQPEATDSTCGSEICEIAMRTSEYLPKKEHVILGNRKAQTT